MLYVLLGGPLFIRGEAPSSFEIEFLTHAWTNLKKFPGFLVKFFQPNIICRLAIEIG